ncbi:unnamed protein product [Periconia digitata]|uniref:DUF7730 domain-containing protein n=1 Tax=Periconia digitata TaxID=1303443 RepID=A0A9W4UUF4_9PLEO|nr:unnamed protein product [Periconia digitata]
MGSIMRPRVLEWTSSSKQEASKISFLDLPRELRDSIFIYALKAPGAIFVQSAYIHAAQEDLEGRAIRYKGQGPPEPERLGRIITSPLVRTCRQIHAESTPILYGHNIFSFSMVNSNFAIFYRSLIRHIVFTVEASRRIYSENLIDMSYWWRRVFWPNVIDASTKFLLRYPGLISLTSPIKSESLWRTWRPAFMMVERKTSEQRIEMAALWLRANCPMEDERLRDMLHMEIMPAKDQQGLDGLRFAVEDDNGNEWDYTEFASAFERMKRLQA